MIIRLTPAYLRALEQAASIAVRQAATLPALEAVRVEYLGRRGKITTALQTLPHLPLEERRGLGRQANEVKRRIEALLIERRRSLPTSDRPIDRSLPVGRPERGHLHPLTLFSRRVMEIWRSFGYDVYEGPELEEAKTNFDDLNVPPDHPARDVQDTFFIQDHPELVLRTHTSTVQIRWPKSYGVKPPFKVVEIGKVYRHEATDATHESMFFQCDGVLVDRQVTMAHLVTTLKAFMDRLYPGKPSRIRPSFFPFVEPGIELDLWWKQPSKPGQWLEILGAGLVHPNVVRSMGLKPNQWQGFAFGMGLDRLAMLEYGIPDIRLFYSGNLEFLQQF
ncbi:MAG: phenylalanine--tRNA ligase subunit alpha [Candidatus Kerfeldbacteria bacterium]|nr:phenylalanine--tRNA ligase subunit alpha [Candidatus Kerfeldbacteria bacterium]